MHRSLRFPRVLPQSRRLDRNSSLSRSSRYLVRLGLAAALTGVLGFGLFVPLGHAEVKSNAPTWADIASFYAGRPVDVSFGDLGGVWGTTGPAESGHVKLAPQIQQSLGNFLKYRNDPNRGAGLGVLGLATLIHEAVHNRHFGDSPAESYQTPGGFYGAANENQATALGSELIPDMLQRFFGIKIGSPLSNAYLKAAKGLSAYQGVYRYPNKSSQFSLPPGY